MARKIPRDSLNGDWAQNPSVELYPEYSFLKEGFWYPRLKLPIAQNRRVCLSLTRIFAPQKYADLFSSWEFVDTLAGPAETIHDGVLFTGDAGHWHYVVDGLANLTADLLKCYPRIFVDATLSDDQVSFLVAYVKSLTARDVEVCKLRDGTYVVRDVCVPINADMSTKVQRFRTAIGCLTLSNAPSHKRIYVSRRHSRNRRLVNEDELCSRLSELGFRAIENETLSLSEQVATYRNAEVVVGPHGAGLTDIAFSERPHGLVDLFHSNRQPFYSALSHALGATYAAVEGTLHEPVYDEQRIDNNDFTVDVSETVRTIKALLG